MRIKKGLDSAEIDECEKSKEGEINKDKSTNFDSVIWCAPFSFHSFANECHLTQGHSVILDKTTL